MLNLLDYYKLELYGLCRKSQKESIKIADETLEYACKMLEDLEYLLSTSIGQEPDGHLTLEWYLDVNWILSVSVSPEGVLYYAARFDNEVISGAEKYIEEIPESILRLIKKVTGGRQ